MEKLLINIYVVAASKQYELMVPDSTSIGNLILLVRKLVFNDKNVDLITDKDSRLFLPCSNRKLISTQTLAESEICNGDELFFI